MNRAHVRFFATLLAVYAVWFVVYDLWLLPDGRLDAWLSHRVAAWSGGVLALAGQAPAVAGRVVKLPGVAGVYLEDGCNGLAALGLFAGFVVAYPGAWRRRAWFVPAGIAVVLVVNVLRVAALALVQRHAPGAFEAAHAVGAQTVFYLVVFALWVAWAHVGERKAPAPAPVPAGAL